MNIIHAALETSKGISEFGMMAITASFFLVLSALMMIACFRWFMKMINDMLVGQKDTMKQLLDETRTQNDRLNDISEGLIPETQMRIKTISNMAFDLSVEKVCRIIKKVRAENHIADKQAIVVKIRILLTNLHEDRNSKFDCFVYRGRKLSTYTNIAWIEQIALVIESEIYNKVEENNSRTYTNVKSAYANIRLEFYHNLNK